MKDEVFRKIKENYNERATDSPFECEFYSRDLAPVPALLVNPLFNTMPDIVVRPASTVEVAEILQMAWKNNIPVTPRAGASTVYFNSVPTKGGILMDLNLIKGIVELDEEKMTVTVKAGTTWSELEEYLNNKGFSTKSYPTSAPVATIGGWFCMMGYGIGSIKYGSLLSQVKAVEVVLPKGEIKEASLVTAPALDWFAGSEGTLGVITQLELEVRPLNSMKHFLIQIPDTAELNEILNKIINAEVLPYNLHFSESNYNKGMKELGFGPDGIDGCLVEVDYEGPEDELTRAEKIITSIITDSDNGAVLLPVENAKEEWDERFLALRLKRGGPSQLGGEVWLPVDRLVNYLEDIELLDKRYKLGLVSYGHIVTSEHATVMTMFYSDETKTLNYIMDLSMVKKIHDIGHRNGGYPYGVGLWNTPYIGNIFQKPQLTELRKRKKKLDSKGIMNPGKVYRPPVLLNSFNFRIGMDVLAKINQVVGRRNRRG